MHGEEAARSLPRIGVSTYREQAVWGVWDERADLLPASYADAVAGAGGVPLLLPPADLGAAGAAAAIDALDGLVLAGGADVDPARYGAERDPNTTAPRADRDSWELALVRRALATDLPILAICRGMQLLAVASGGTLIQHLPDVVGNDAHCPQLGAHGRHEVRIATGKLLTALGARATVATHHHQAVDLLGADLAAVGWAVDGTVEAIEHATATWVLGVQWHPEAHDGAALFAAFVQACARFRTRTRVEA
jgi:gamma-glutamyl-gamma-aminobutyrate hydrolase PuuD